MPVARLRSLQKKAEQNLKKNESDTTRRKNHLIYPRCTRKKESAKGWFALKKNCFSPRRMPLATPSQRVSIWHRADPRDQLKRLTCGHFLLTASGWKSNIFATFLSPSSLTSRNADPGSLKGRLLLFTHLTTVRGFILLLREDFFFQPFSPFRRLALKLLTMVSQLAVIELLMELGHYALYLPPEA